MSPKSTRSSKPKEEESENKTKIIKAPAVFKIFYINQSLLDDSTSELQLERFYHPGRNAKAWFITHADKEIMEVLEFTEPRRSWLINSEVCSNGRIYMTTSIDALFLALHHIRKHCASKALELETIHDKNDASVNRLLSKFVSKDAFGCIADVKTVGDMTFYKYNAGKTLAWLTLKTKRLADCLKKENIHCGRSALSQNYKRSEKAAEENVDETDFLRVACEIIGDYLDLDLHENLKQRLNLPKEVKSSEDKDEDTKKRKSLTTLKAEKNKKIKMEDQQENEDETLENGATDKLKNSSLLDESLEVQKQDIKFETSPVISKTEPLKERIMTTKEKALAKSAKGTKSIASFFGKK